MKLTPFHQQVRPLPGQQGLLNYDHARGKQYLYIDNPRLDHYETGEVYVSCYYDRDTGRRAHMGCNLGVVSSADGVCPELRTLEGEVIVPAWLNQNDQQMLLLDWDHRVAVLLTNNLGGHGRYCRVPHYAYYPTPEALPVPNGPIIVSRSDRKEGNRVVARAKMLQGPAELMWKCLPEAAQRTPMPYDLREHWRDIVLGDDELNVEAALTGVTPGDLCAIRMLDHDKLRQAARKVTEHRYLKF